MESMKEEEKEATKRSGQREPLGYTGVIGSKQMFSDCGDFSSPYIAISRYFGKMGRFVGFEKLPS